MQIEPMTRSHADAVLAIYQAGIDEGNATFETSAPPRAAFTATRLPARCYVATEHGGDRQDQRRQLHGSGARRA
jgi:phosphinothricin acetyltransferase